MSEKRLDECKIKGFRCPQCRDKTRLIYQTEKILFFKCRTGPYKVGNNRHTVFAVPKSQFEGGE